MMFRIADTFRASLGKLTNDEQKAAKNTAFDLQMDPSQPGMKFHKLDRAKDKNFWSVRVNRDVRIIVHRTDASMLLCYVDHHDKAYDWAERRKLERHPKTGAAQLVKIRERVETITVPEYVAPAAPAESANHPLFADTADSELLGYGVPEEWLGDVKAADEDQLLSLVDHLPEEAGEALLELATGGNPEPVSVAAESDDPFDHPDAQRRFSVMANHEELERALDFPWDRWSVFLHPTQRELVAKEFNGPARVSGSAGTGKTVVALHRAVHLTRQFPESRVLLTTFSRTLANLLKVKLRRLVGNEPHLAERIDVEALDDVGGRLAERNLDRKGVASDDQVKAFIGEELNDLKLADEFSERFVWTEWREVVDAWQLSDWADYRDVARLGRKTRLPESKRESLWTVYAAVIRRLESANLRTQNGMFARLADHLSTRDQQPYDFSVVDEAQDISVQQLRFLAALAGGQANGLFFAGDLGQRIFQSPFSWKSLGVDIRGRSRTLRINYRTSHQIRRCADHLLAPELSDVDGNAETRKGVVSVFNSPPPIVELFDSDTDEISYVTSYLTELASGGTELSEIGIFVRSEVLFDRVEQAVSRAGLNYQILGADMKLQADRVAVCTMHLAKGLEFRAAIVMACDEEMLPFKDRIERVGDEADLKEVYDTERHLLYVACTRARDQLLVTAVEPASEFLEDLLM